MNTQKSDILKDKFEQLAAISNEIKELHKDAAVIVAIKGKEYSHVHLRGSGSDMVAILATTARKDKYFANILKTAVDAYENA